MIGSAITFLMHLTTHLGLVLMILSMGSIVLMRPDSRKIGFLALCSGLLLTLTPAILDGRQSLTPNDVATAFVGLSIAVIVACLVAGLINLL